MREKEFVSDKVRYAIAAAVVAVVACGAWFGVRGAMEYESLTFAQNCAVALNKTVIFPMLSAMSDESSTKSYYRLRDKLYESGRQEQSPAARNAAWLAIYFAEYLAQNCGKKMDLSSPLNNESCTGRIHCGDDVLDIARESLLALGRERDIPDDLVELYYTNAFLYCAGVASRSRTREGVIKRAHVEAVRALIHPAFSGAAPAPPRAVAYRNMLISMHYVIDMEQDGADPQRSWENFKKAVDDAEWQSKRVRDELLHMVIDNFKKSRFYKHGPGEKKDS